MEGRESAPYLPALVVLLSVVLTALVLLQLPHHIAVAVQRENGPIENATVVLYGAGAVLAWVFGKRRLWGRGYTGGLLLLVLGLRELDFHTRFTTRSITQVNFLLHAHVPPGEKVIGLGVYLLVTVLVVRLIKGSRSLFSAVRNRRPYAISTFSGIFLIPVSVLFDKWITRILRKRGGMTIDDDLYLACQLLEETLELAIPLMFVIAMLQWKKETENLPS